MVEYDKLNDDSSRWERLMNKTKNLRDKIWGDDELAGDEDGRS